MARPSNKAEILREGLEVVRRRGFNAAGVREITSAAGVPQGSFTNHFASKEAFGLEILDVYFADVQAVMQSVLESEGDPLARLRTYFDVITERFEGRGWQHGCLIGNMSLESAENSEPIRARLDELFNQWREPFARCIEEAAASGRITLAVPACDLADFLLASWQGAILRMKVERSPDALERFKDIVFTTVLAEGKNS